MEKLDLYLFHGFLGDPLDWSPIVEALPHTEGLQVFTPDLLEVFNASDKPTSLAQAGELFAQSVLRPTHHNIFVGYSLGGRLAMHLPLRKQDKAILLAAHPGLREGFAERRRNDQRWVEKSKKGTQQEWFDQWNGQDVFKSDSKRPLRSLSESRFLDYMQILESWSLAEQEDRTPWLKENQESIGWAYGEKDHKYATLAKTLADFLPANHIQQVPGAGHGLIFENPLWVANRVKEVIYGC